MEREKTTVTDPNGRLWHQASGLYSGSRLADADRVQGLLAHAGRTWVCTGTCTGRDYEAYCYEAVPLAQYQGEVWRHKDYMARQQGRQHCGPGWYIGRYFQHQGRDYVLTNHYLVIQWEPPAGWRWGDPVGPQPPKQLALFV